MADPSPDALPGGDAWPGAGLPGHWQSALLVAVPEAEPAVGEHRARLDSSARDGVDAHLTVLYPFLPPASINGAVLAALRRLFAGFAPFDITLDRVSWFGEEVVWLAPRDDRPFRALICATRAAFPGCPPYGNQYADVIPHLTIGDRDDPGALRAAAEAVRGHLPVAAMATEVTLMAGPAPGNPDIPPGQWRTLTVFPLGAGT
jgi:2'-5' RNA ligase